MKSIHLEMTVQQDGVLNIPELKTGDRVEVTVVKKEATKIGSRQFGWAKGWVEILPGFDDPIPGMEDYY